MFDLFRSRDKAVRILLGALLVLVALSMLTYLIPSYNTGGDPSDVVVAEVGKELITLPDVQRVIQNAMRSRQMPPEVLPNFIPQMVESMITERAMAYEAGRLGYQVTDADVAQAIQMIIPSLFQDGKFAGKDIYAGFLAQQNLTIAEFERDLKRQLLATRLRTIAMEGVIVTPRDIEQEFRRRNEKVKLAYARIANDKVRAEIQPTDADLRSMYEASKARYMNPEKRSLAILVADQARMEQSVQVTDADLERLYNQNKDRFRTPDRVKVRHILLKTLGKPEAEDAKMRAKAEDLIKQIKAGADFAKLAKENSEDPGSAVKGGELPEWVTRGQTVPEFEKAAFGQKPGETSGPVKTQYGYHIIQVLAKEQARLRPFEEVKGELAAEFKKQRVNELMQQASDRASSALAKDPAHPEKVAADLNMQLVKVENVSAGDPLPEVGVSKDFEDAVASLKKGEVSQPVSLGNNKVAVALVTNIVPGRAATYEEVQAKVRDAFIASKLEGLMAQRANQLYERAKSMNGDLSAAAKSMGFEVKTSELFGRQGAVEGLGSANFFSEAFTKPVGALVGPLSINDGRVVAKVLEHAEGDLSQLPAQRDSIREEIKSRKARERNALFEDGLRQTLIKEGKIKVHKNVLQRLSANYRG
jgi:peptidyl-prolyl cis-trans isomerase D